MPLADIARDLRYAIRGLLASPGFTLGIIGSLTLGIVINTAAFSFINAAMFRSFPGVRDQHELVRLGFERREGRGAIISSTFAEYHLLAASVPALTEVAAHLRADLAVAIDGQSSALRGAIVTRNYFEVLGMRPAAGRFFVPDDARTAVAVISHDLWRRRFNEEARAVGETVLVNGVSVEIVGVAAPRFHDIQKGEFDLEVWMLPELAHLVLRDDSRRPVSIATAGFRWFTYVGRRRPGATLAEVQTQAAAVARQIDAARPAGLRGTTIWTSRVWLNDPAANIVLIISFLAVPLLVLVIACVNAGNLLLARASRQMREWQVRLALGASSWRIVRQVLAECVLLAIVSAAASLAFTAWALQFVASTVPIPVPVDVRVQAFTIAVTLLAAVAFGLGPAFRVVRGATRERFGLRTTAVPTRSRVRAVLIGLQAAVSLGLLATGIQFLNTARLGFGAPPPPDADRLLIAAIDVDPLNLAPEAADTFYRRVLETTESLPGVVAAGVATASPLGVFGGRAAVRVWLPHEDRPQGRRGLAPVLTGRYFQATRAPLIAGRYFTSADEGPRPRTAVVNEWFSRRYLASKGVGTTIRVADPESPASAPIDVEIVGVVGAEYGIKRDVALVYLPAPLAYSPARTLYVQFDDSGRFNVAALEQVVRSVDYRVPIRRVSTLRDQDNDTDAERRLLAGGVAASGVFALALATGGLYGVVSYLVALRRREIGVRLALGASPRSVVGLIIRQGLLPAAIGALIGAGGAVAIGLVVRSRLHGASPVDPTAFAGATAALGLALLAACILPARHAARVDPIVVLREE